jgi:hypothetical protein
MKLFELFGRIANPHRFKDEQKRKAEEAKRAQEQEEAMKKAMENAELNKRKNDKE